MLGDVLAGLQEDQSKNQSRQLTVVLEIDQSLNSLKVVILKLKGDLNTN